MSLLLATLILVLVTLVPTFELRASIPLGLLASQQKLPFLGVVAGFGLPVWYVLLVCVTTNILLAPLWYWLLGTVVAWLRSCWSWFDAWYVRRLEKAQRRIERPLERWGWLGLVLFIAVPLPGSGVYTGGLVAHALGLSRRRFSAAAVLGVLGAATLVTLVTLGVVAIV